MRTKLFLITALLGGCSLVYSGSNFQGGTGSDAGSGLDTGVAPVDTGVAPVDTGVAPVDMGVAPVDAGACHTASDCPGMGMRCDTVSGMCKAGCDEDSDCTALQTCNTGSFACEAMTCAADATCPADSWCTGGHCTACDGDGDNWNVPGAPALRCDHAGRGDDDCDDTNPLMYPYAPADCSNPAAGACPLGLTFDLPAGAGTVFETGVTAENTVFTDGTSVVAPRGAVWVSVGNDSPRLPTSGTANGFVGFVGNAPSGPSHIYASPLNLTGVSPAEPIFDLFNVGSASFSRGTSSSGGEVLIVTAGEASGGVSRMGLLTAPIQTGGMAFTAATMSGYANQLSFGTSGVGAVGGMVVSDTPGLVGGVNSPQGVQLVYGTPASINQDPPGSIYDSFVGGWIASQGTAALWLSGTTSTAVDSISIWNGVDETGWTPEGLGALTISSPQQLSPYFRGDLAWRNIAGVDHFVAVVPVASSSVPPVGQLAVIRWSWTVPASGDSVAAHLSDLTVHALDLGASHAINGLAGASVTFLDDEHALVAYQASGQVVLREIGVAPGALMVENPAAIPILQVGAAETYVGLDLGGGFYPTGSTTGIGRLVIAGMVERGGSIHEIRVRAIESCVH